MARKRPTPAQHIDFKTLYRAQQLHWASLRQGNEEGLGAVVIQRSA
jgi:hypothetical protein